MNEWMRKKKIPKQDVCLKRIEREKINIFFFSSFFLFIFQQMVRCVYGENEKQNKEKISTHKCDVKIIETYYNSESM